MAESFAKTRRCCHQNGKLALYCWVLFHSRKSKLKSLSGKTEQETTFTTWQKYKLQMSVFLNIHTCLHWRFQTQYAIREEIDPDLFRKKS